MSKASHYEQGGGGGLLDLASDLRGNHHPALLVKEPFAEALRTGKPVCIDRLPVHEMPVDNKCPVSPDGMGALIVGWARRDYLYLKSKGDEPDLSHIVADAALLANSPFADDQIYLDELIECVACRLRSEQEQNIY